MASAAPALQQTTEDEVSANARTNDNDKANALTDDATVADSVDAVSPAPTRTFTKPANRLPKENDIHSHFWPQQAGGDTADNNGQEPTAPCINPSPSTLNSSAAAPEALSYVMLFKDANPRWKSDGIVFVKTNLALLPGFNEQCLSGARPNDNTDGVKLAEALAAATENAKASDNTDGIKLTDEHAATSDNANPPGDDKDSDMTEVPTTSPENVKASDNTESIKLIKEPTMLPNHTLVSDDDKGGKLAEKSAVSPRNMRIGDNTEWLKLTPEPVMLPNHAMVFADDKGCNLAEGPAISPSNIRVGDNTEWLKLTPEPANAPKLTAASDLSLPAYVDNKAQHHPKTSANQQMFAVYTIADLSTNGLASLEHQLNAVEDFDGDRCSLATNPDFTGCPLKDVFNYHLRLRDEDKTFHPHFFIVATSAQYLEEGVVVVNLNAPKEDADDNGKDGVDQARCEVGKAANWCIRNGKTNTSSTAAHSSMEPKQDNQSEESEQEDGGVKLGVEHVNLPNLSVQTEVTAINDTDASTGASPTKQADELTPEGPTPALHSTPQSSPQTDQATPLLTAPIAIFEQQHGRNGGFHFLGYHTLARLDFLAPHSEPLMRMLEQKFSHKDRFGNVKQKQRHATAWRTSLGQPWAVLNFTLDPIANAELPAPVIKCLEGRERRKHKRDRDHGRDRNRGRNRDRNNRKTEDKNDDDTPKTANEVLREMRLEPTNSSAQAMERRTPTSASAPEKPAKEAATAPRSRMNRPTGPPAGYNRLAWSAAAIAKTDAERSRALEEELKNVGEQPLPEFKETFKQRGGSNDGGDGGGGDEKAVLPGREGNDDAAAVSASAGEMGDQKGGTDDKTAEKNEEDGEESEGEDGASAEPDAGCRL